MAEYRKNKVWKRIVNALGVITVFCTTYALILPVLTMDNTDRVIGDGEYILAYEDASFEVKPIDLKDMVTEGVGYNKDITVSVQEEITDDQGNIWYKVESRSGNDVLDKKINEEYPFFPAASVKLSENRNEPSADATTATLDNGVVVSVDAPNSSLPCDKKDVSVSANIIRDDDTRVLVERCLTAEGMDPEDAIIVNIDLLENGAIIEPTGDVDLFFEVGGLMRVAKVYHLDEEEKTLVDMEAVVNSDGLVEVETDHFSTYVLAKESGDKYNDVNVNYTWDQSIPGLTNIYGTTTSPDKDLYFGVATYDGTVWTAPATWDGAYGKNASVNITFPTFTSMDEQFRVELAEKKNSQYNVKSTSQSFGVMDLLEQEKEGFTEWLAGDYLSVFGGTTPANLADLYSAFATYKQIPNVTITPRLDGSMIYIDAAVDNGQSYTYKWEYQDENGQWQPLPTSDAEGAPQVTGPTLTVNNYDVFMGETSSLVRCKVYDGSGQVWGVSNELQPRQEQFDSIAEDINTELDLEHYMVYCRVNDGTPSLVDDDGIDLSIGGERYNKYFFFKHVLQDLGLPVREITKKDPVQAAADNLVNATTFKNYLAQEYLKAEADDKDGMDRVREIWERYIFDMYDPTADSSNGFDNISSTYYPVYTYGDQYAKWPKDKATSSFNTSSGLTPTLEDLDYDFLEKGVEYDSFVDQDKGLEKTTTAVAAGDNNSNRRYNVDLSAKVHGRCKAPVVMIFTIQTSWQMFDLYHANLVKVNNSQSATDDYASIEVGSAANNTALANLFAVKKALIAFADYMETTYQGNNLVLAITEIQHGKASSLFTVGKTGGKNGNNQTTNMYICNNPDTIKEALYSWNSFGNCEHVHYDNGGSDEITNVCSSLRSNLSGWLDATDYNILYDEIRKVSVVVGGSTENTDGNNGYGVPLPWSSFRSAGLNSVYAIRCNEGTPVTDNADDCISWLEDDSNIGSSPFKDGEGDTYTKEYIATDWEAVYNDLIEIAETEMSAQGASFEGTNLFIENTTITDTIENEFKLNRNEPIVATVYDKNNREEWSEEIPWDDENLIITENTDGTTTVSYNYGDIYNLQSVKLHFQIEAKEDYLGSNNVYSNVGTPSLHYEHTVTDQDGNPTSTVEPYNAGSDDTPQVNVPIRFSAQNGGSTSVKINTDVDLASLDKDSENNTGVIEADLHDRVDNYDQINGTVSYTWVMPDGTEVPLTGLSVHITNGQPDSTLPTIAELTQTYTPTVPGDYTAYLKPTFTPDSVDPSGHFANDNGKTATAVNPKTEKGKVTVRAVDADSTYDYYLQKKWGPGTTDDMMKAVKVIISDGNGKYLKDNGANANPRWSFVDHVGPGGATEYPLKEDNNWEQKVTGLPAVRTEGDNEVILDYTLVEKDGPGNTLFNNFEPTYSEGTKTIAGYYGEATVTVTPTANVKDVSRIEITYTYNGQTYTYTEDYTKGEKFEKNKARTFTLTNLPTNGNQAYGSVTVSGVQVYKIDKGNYVLINTTDLGTPSVSAVTVKQGQSVDVPTLIVTNTPTRPATVTFTVTKTIEGSDDTTAFPFTIELMAEGAELPQPPEGADYTVDENGVAHFTLRNGESIDVQIPIDSTITLREVSHDGYLTRIDGVDGDEYEISFDNDNIQMGVENIPGYEMPSTGGIGTMLFTALGTMLLMTGAIGLFFLQRKKRSF